MKLLCVKCGKEQEVVITPSGPHLKATCGVCERYVKFINKEEWKEIEEEEERRYGV